MWTGGETPAASGVTLVRLTDGIEQLVVLGEHDNDILSYGSQAGVLRLGRFFVAVFVNLLLLS